MGGGTLTITFYVYFYVSSTIYIVCPFLYAIERIPRNPYTQELTLKIARGGDGDTIQVPKP